jgi:hypothetical protein
VATYTPKPIDTSTVLLNNAQRRLIEQLAAHWAKKRVEGGWQHGPARNDQIKAHPSLVPYDELPNSEKDYDRVMVEQVIRAVVALATVSTLCTLWRRWRWRASVSREQGLRRTERT